MAGSQGSGAGQRLPDCVGLSGFRRVPGRRGVGGGGAGGAGAAGQGAGYREPAEQGLQHPQVLGRAQLRHTAGAAPRPRRRAVSVCLPRHAGRLRVQVRQA